MSKKRTQKGVFADSASLGQETVKAAAAALASDFNEAGVVAAVAAVHQIATRSTFRILNSWRAAEHQLACRKACSWCCRIHVAASPPEVLAIAHHLRSTHSAEVLSEVVSRLRDLDSQTHGLNADDRPLLPCALLADGLCSVYPVRPLSCRAFNSLDVAVCQRSYGGGGDEEIPIFAPPFDAVMTVGGAMRAGFEMADLYAEPVELTAALLKVLDDPTTADRWLAGDPVFADVAAEAVTPLRVIA